MPKIIEDLKRSLIAEAQKQIRDHGYGAVTIRSIAKGCGVGVGTVYNYFPSKDALIATHLLEDWSDCVRVIDRTAGLTETAEPVLRCIYEQLTAFAARHAALFRDADASAGFAGAFSQYHGLLRHQLAQPLTRFCDGNFAAAFVAESLLTWTMDGKAFDEIYEILKKLF